MLLQLGISCSFLPIVFVSQYIYGLIKNLRSAQASGLPYIVTPIYYFNILWIMIQPLVLPLLRRLPQSLQGSWVDASTKAWAYLYGHRVFRDIGSDTFIAVAPGANILYTADADVINQVLSRRSDFPKPTELPVYKMANIFGINVVTQEGEIWRRHRRITAPSFSDENNRLVWTESIRQAEFMTQSWYTNAKTSSVGEDTLRLSLHVISRAGFGIRTAWPGVQNRNEAPEKANAGLDVLDLQRNRSMTFVEAMDALLENVFLIMVFPSWLLALMPLRSFRRANHAHSEWSTYMDQLYEHKATQLSASPDHPISLAVTTTDSGADLMGALMLQSGLFFTSTTNKSPPASASIPVSPTLTKEEITGNAFIFLTAGHETSAHTIQMCILHLATSPSAQRSLQHSLDTVLGSRPPSQWTYESDFSVLERGFAGAVVDEAMRLVPSVINIPKTVAGRSQEIVVGGRRSVVRGGTGVYLTAAAVHRNEAYWPVRGGEGEEWPVDEFCPARWMGAGRDGGKAGRWRPVRGAFVPFSDGARSCLGKRFALVEIVAVLAFVFKRFSVELAVDGEEDDVREKEMGLEERRIRWRRIRWRAAREKAKTTIRTGCTTLVSLRLRKGDVPIRLVRRGGEQYFDCE